MSYGFPDPRPYSPTESRKAALRRLAAKRGWEHAHSGQPKSPPTLTKTHGRRVVKVDVTDDEWWAYMFGYDMRDYWDTITKPLPTKNPFGLP